VTDTVETLELPPQHRPEPPTGAKRTRLIVTIAIVVPAIWSVLGLDISMDRIIGAPADMWNIVRQMFPPDLSYEQVFERTLPKVMESLYIAWIGTLIGAFFSFFLSFLAAKNLSPTWLTTVVRNIFNAIRAFPELLLAFILLPITGLGAWTGTLAIGLHSIGTLGKLSSEVIEGIDPGPLEAIDSAGGRRTSVMRYGVLPQVLPTIVAYWLYRFEINLRVSAFLGVIGAGGVGAELVSPLRCRNFPAAGTVLLITIGVVLIIDAISSAIRRRIIAGKSGEEASSEIFAEATPGEVR
jgi:phosphonate transport system permease protein